MRGTRCCDYGASIDRITSGLVGFMAGMGGAVTVPLVHAVLQTSSLDAWWAHGTTITQLVQTVLQATSSNLSTTVALVIVQAFLHGPGNLGLHRERQRDLHLVVPKA